MALDASAQDEIQVFSSNSRSHPALSDGRGAQLEPTSMRDVVGLKQLAITEHDFGRAACPMLHRRPPANTRSRDYEVNRRPSFEA